MTGKFSKWSQFFISKSVGLFIQEVSRWFNI